MKEEQRGDVGDWEGRKVGKQRSGWKKSKNIY